MAARLTVPDPGEARPVRALLGGAAVGAAVALVAVAAAFQEPGTATALVGLAVGVIVFAISASLLLRNRARTGRAFRALRAAHARDEGVDVAVLASAVGHDINNLLQVCAVQLAELRELADDARAARGIADELSATLGDIGSLAGSLLGVGRAGPEGREADLGRVLRESAELARRHRALRRSVLHLEVPPDGPRVAPVDLLRRAVLNLLINAGEAGARRILLRLVPRNGEVAIEVHDDGHGVAEEDRSRILHSFVSTKEGGRGLGLTAARVLAREQGGTLTVGTSPLGGACFRLGLCAERVPV